MPQADFNLSMKCTKWFFDKGKVRALMSIKTRRALEIAGALIRRTARQSMQYVTSVAEQERRIAEGTRKQKVRLRSVSAPGEPPRAVRPHPWIREFLYYAYDPARRSVVVGPVRLPRTRINVPQLHEFGGQAVVRSRRRIRKLGHGGEVRIGGRAGRTTHLTETRLGGLMPVTYMKLRTGAQVARANNLNALLYGSAANRIVTYPPRPFMAPAVAKLQPTLARLWLEAGYGSGAAEAVGIAAAG